MQNSFFMMKRILLLSFLAVLINVAKSQVVINEISYTNVGPAITDGYGNASDYIELYNATQYGIATSMSLNEVLGNSPAVSLQYQQ